MNEKKEKIPFASMALYHLLLQKNLPLKKEKCFSFLWLDDEYFWRLSVLLLSRNRLFLCDQDTQAFPQFCEVRLHSILPMLSADKSKFSIQHEEQISFRHTPSEGTRVTTRPGRPGTPLWSVDPCTNLLDQPLMQPTNLWTSKE